MKPLHILMISLLSSLILTGCNDDSEDATTGRIELSITDAPIDDANIEAVYISIIGIELKSGAESWIELDSFEEPVKINLLDYQNGESFFLTEEVVQAGEYSEIRLILAAPEGDGPNQSNPGTYLAYKDGTFEPLFVPSGAQSGYKAKGEFTVPAGGVTGLTIDFDVRKSVVKAGNSGKYLLKPVLRLIENQNVAMVKGSVATVAEYSSIRVFAYADDSFNESELVPVDGVDFPNAITSGTLSEDNSFTLSFMEPGTYDLYAAGYNESGEFISIVAEWQDVVLMAGDIKEVTLQEEE
jgi:hypothetical protein